MGNTQIDQNLFAALYMLGFNFSGGDLSSGVRGAGSGQHLASVLQEGRENANIDAGLGFIWRISVIASRMMVTQVPSSSSDEDGQRM